jgi:hypothetical protein
MIETKIKIEIVGKLAKELIDHPAEFSRTTIWAGMTKLVETIEARAKKEAPVKSSNLFRLITSWVSPDGIKGTVNSGAPYSEFVHRGTGTFGPFHQRIFPVSKKALFWPGALHPVRSIKGMKPNPFFDRALKQITPQKVFDDGVWGFLRKMQ